MKNGILAALVLGLPLAAAIILATGIAAGGYFVGHGLFAARASERAVTVKGLAEREVAANLAMWPIVFSTTGNDLVAIQSTLDASAKKVAAFLQARGFTPAEFSLSSPRVTDRDAQGGRMRGEAGDRYVAEQTVTLRSGRITPVKVAIQQSGELIRDGVALVRSYEYNTTFLYTSLDEIKPAMIAEATKDARKAAEQFARDSGSRVGAIRNAQQGFFDIQDRDPFSPEIKKIRVVTTVQYFLED
jgi:uncharacterized protein